jgi:hypothetical protein
VEFDIPLRTRGEDGHTTGMRNIRKGKPEASLFEVPKDYKPVAYIMELMGNDRAVDEEQQDAGAEKSDFKFPIKLPPGMKLPFPKQ